MAESPEPDTFVTFATKGQSLTFFTTRTDLNATSALLKVFQGEGKLLQMTEFNFHMTKSLSEALLGEESVAGNLDPNEDLDWHEKA